ncbi:MAG: enoyl-CoA hydratase [Candidatus Marinimicrobia bacterium]|nr:enoyl-CoA hydratase [Candidatus Neomarinimicrobiota bacterium]|tara:strand:- start:949 stop:1344 length:396 start_codon:yes stop_codon:yes gene_type:complete
MKWKINTVYKKSFKITKKMVEDYANVSQDKNPIHLDNEYAKNTIFKKRIVHGMLLAGLISSLIGNKFPGNGSIYLNQNLSFKKPVYLNETVEIVIKIIHINDKGWLELETNCFTNNNLVIEGSALIIPPIN